ncbi:MAG: urease accessory protein UreE [Hyphomicrobiales bacterium]|nr:urease accessory protein UreE [Hyphomicrobiales bacterium]MDE2018704.1 urease accessory protein UreE [Hyphomicrobiales bacterium]
MKRATDILRAGNWSGRPADALVLDADARARRRGTATTTAGETVLVDLAAPSRLRGGDALKLEDGRLVEVVAAPEPLAEIRAAEPRGLTRLAWHLGNRHAPAEIGASRIRIRRDAVLEEMARALGARTAHIEAPFEPEGGAYDAHGRAPHEEAEHGHDHRHDHGHDHDHGHHGHGHGHDREP